MARRYRANPAAPPRRGFARVAAGNLARADEQAPDQEYETPSNSDVQKFVPDSK